MNGIDSEKIKKQFCDIVDEVSKNGKINDFRVHEEQTDNSQEFYDFKLGYKLNENIKK